LGYLFWRCEEGERKGNIIRTFGLLEIIDYARNKKKEEEMEKAKSNATTTMPTPITILWKYVLMLPIVGIVDSKRAQEIMETMLARIHSFEAKIIILDILGVAIVDSAVANHLMKISNATKLMGCNCVITGISPSIAQTLVNLGIDLKNITTRTNLKDGLEYAFKILGLEVRDKKRP
jgi:rsbT co-antagonist protein RsbR